MPAGAGIDNGALEPLALVGPCDVPLGPGSIHAVVRPAVGRRLLSLWQGKTWAARIAMLESLLSVWPATALAMILLAIAIGLLLLG